MKIKRFFMILLVWIWLGCSAAYAEDGNNVFDNAELFTNAQLNEFEQNCSEAAKKLDMRVGICTEGSLDTMFSSNSSEETIERHARDMYKKHFGTERGIILYINLDGREVSIFEYNEKDAYFRFSDGNLDDIRSAVTEPLRYDDWYSGAKKFLSSAVEEAPAGFFLEKGKFISTRILIVGAIVCIAIGGIVVLIMYSGQKSKKVTDGAVYMKDGSDVQILEQADIYTHTTKQVIHHESRSGGGGGGGGGGHSSSGHF